MHAKDAPDADVSEADVVFIFRPMSALKTLVPALLPRMKPGTAIILAHEQKQLAAGIVKPDERHAVVHRDGGASLVSGADRPMVLGSPLSCG